jgi:hypothetical protein
VVVKASLHQVPRNQEVRGQQVSPWQRPHGGDSICHCPASWKSDQGLLSTEQFGVPSQQEDAN